LIAARSSIGLLNTLSRTRTREPLPEAPRKHGQA